MSPSSIPAPSGSVPSADVRALGAACPQGAACTLVEGVPLALYERGGPDAPWVLFDPGGPASPLMTRSQLDLATAGWLDGVNIVTVVERWHLGVPDGCLPGVDGAWSRPSRCGELVVPADRVAAALGVLADRTGAIDGLVGASFGAVRVSDLASRMTERPWVVLLSPAPPSGTTAERVLGDRARRVRAALDVPDLSCARLPASRWPDRGPLPCAVVGGALVSAAYDAGANATAIGPLLRAAAQDSSVERRDLRSSGLAFLMRHGDGSADPALAGYLAEVCPTYRDWGALPSDVGPDPLTDALSALHAPCATREIGADVLDRGVPHDDQSVLLVLNAADPIVGDGAAWRRALPAADVVGFSYPGHLDPGDDVKREMRSWVTDHGTVPGVATPTG